MTGLGAALFLARRGHSVDLFEADEAPAPAGREAAFHSWVRRGVPQARHSHQFLGLSSKVLSEEAPDLLATLEDGAFVSRPWGELAEEPWAYGLMARRLVYEAIFRKAVEGETRVAIHTGVRVTGLLARDAGKARHVIGLTIDESDQLGADFVIDASGRWTSADRWLADIDARPWREELQETPIFYLTRWYRLRAGKSLPPSRYPLGVLLPYMTVLAFPADDGTFSVSLGPSMADPCRSRLRDPEIFSNFLRELPAIAPLLDCGEPISEPAPLARINNCYRSLVDDAGPCVTGFALLGDATNHTNPTLGRGVSLGLAQAQRLAKTIERAVDEPDTYALDLDRWLALNISPWFRSQVETDGAYIRALAASLSGEPPAAPPPRMLFRRAMQALSVADAEVALAVAREAHLLAPPGSSEADPSVAAKVHAFMDKAGSAKPARQGPTRREFEAIAG